jgi:hypothetical protein
MKIINLINVLNIVSVAITLLLLSCGSDKATEQKETIEFDSTELVSNAEQIPIDNVTKGVEHLRGITGDYIFLKKEKDNFYRFDPCVSVETELLIGNYAGSPETWYFGENYSYTREDKSESRQYDISKAYANNGEITIKAIEDYNNEENLTTTFKLTPTNNEKVWHLSDLEHGPDGRYITLEEYKDNFEIIACSNIELILQEIPLSYTPLTEMREGEIEGEWVFYEECHYGTGGFNIDKTGDYIHFSGGGDGVSYGITELKKLNDKLTITFRDDFSEETQQLIIEKIFDDYSVINGNLGWIISPRYVSDKSQGDFYTVTEPCDD